MSNRRLAREVLVQSLYESQLSNVDPRLALRSNLQRRNGGDDVQQFAQRVLKELMEHRPMQAEGQAAQLSNIRMQEKLEAAKKKYPELDWGKLANYP